MASLDGSSDVKHAGNDLLLPVVFTLTIFVSASLLFFVQPLFAKLILPQIGGAPAVWTTAMLFFQVVLLAGYVYAHLLTKYAPIRWQLPIHLLFWGLALSFLPLSVAQGWQYDPGASTTWQTLTLLALGVGVPFGMLSANAPLLQSWYARTSGPSAHDPYFLYGSSNFGSLLALLAFPLVAEPLLGARAIGMGWTYVFVIFGVLLAGSGLLALRHPGNYSSQIKSSPAASKITASQVLSWIFIAFVPSSLMLAVTTKVSTDMGAIPLIWVLPLSIYIFSFVITFTNTPRIPDRILPALSVAACTIMAVLMSSQGRGLPTWGSALLFAPLLLVVAIYAHRKLYQLRPESGHLTVFYICMSVGGALGGLFNSIVAPNVFDSIHEGWISVVCAACIGLIGTKRPGLRPIAYGILLGIFMRFVLSALPGYGTTESLKLILLLLSVAGLTTAAVALWRTPVAVVLAIGAFLLMDVASQQKDFLLVDRSFFGAHRIYDEGNLRIYANGTTVHGFQFLEDFGKRPTPLSYYHPDSPMAQVVTTSEGIETANIAVVGLGVGSLACYGTPNQSWEFYEIDQMVDQAARNPSLFTFLSDCAPGSQTHLGDARIVLAQQDFSFDIMVLDAYSSDSIPAHLVTTEAVEMYLDKLAADGQLVFHITNRYYDLTQPLARIARDLGLGAVIRYDPQEAVTSTGAATSRVVVLSPSQGRLDHLLKDGRWKTIVADDKAAWTDDRTNLLSALK